MGGLGRGRLVVALGGQWRLYTHQLPGWTMLGVVQRGAEAGALARSPAGLLCLVNAGAVKALDQRKAQVAYRDSGGTVSRHWAPRA